MKFEMDSSNKFECEICEQNFSTNQYKKQHIKIVHGEQKIFECNVCSKNFHQKHVLMSHVETNHKIKDHNCKFCEKNFHRSRLNYHIKTIHERQSNFKCDSCGKSFTQSGDLKKHMCTSRHSMKDKTIANVILVENPSLHQEI